MNRITTAFSGTRRLLIAASLLAMIQPGAAAAQSAAPFYAGKQITLICGAAVGGGYDSVARLFARHFGRFIPGNPTIIVQNMPAAGSLAAANLIANTAPRDGLTIALIQRGMLLTRLINPTAVRFDLNTLNWIGSLSSEVGVAFAWYTDPHKTAQDLFDKELIVGGHTGVDPELTPRLYNAVLGTKFKIVTGYNGTADIGLAIQRGEVAGIGDWSWSSLKKQKPDWIRDHKITLLLQSGLQNDPELPDVPNALDFAKTPSDRAVISLFLTQKKVARPIIAPPGVPPERIAILRAALTALASDPEFLADADHSGLEVSPIPAEAVEQVIALISATPRDVADRYTKAFAAPSP
ncbi:MAG TPA: tripartite tricarboxylate transporter substrate-binding protein [Xanthobacteraceae bacterium]|nr:tripartite tricarboxylate transporter substrate-binding protein [Xanthobacteraceae bacterium]